MAPEWRPRPRCGAVRIAGSCIGAVSSSRWSRHADADHCCRSDQRGHSERHGHGPRGRAGDAEGRHSRRADITQWPGDGRRARAGPLYGPSRVSGVLSGRAQGSSRTAGRQPPHHRPPRREFRGNRRGEAGRPGRRSRSAQRCVRIGADARADGYAVGRSRRNAAAVDGYGGPGGDYCASTASKAAGCRRSRRSSRFASPATSLRRRITAPTRSSSRSSRSPASDPSGPE